MLATIRRTLRRWLVDSQSTGSVAGRLRRRRWQIFLTLCHPSPDELLLDVGGRADDSFAAFWTGRTVRVNLQRVRPLRRTDYAVVADARALPFRERAFRVTFSNSVVEHVGPWEEQRKAAKEIERVSERYFVQVPDKHTPLEPHYLFPFFQYLSERWQRSLHRWLPFSRVPRDGFYPVWLLTAKELQHLFPTGRIIRERVLGFPKSCYAVRATDRRTS